MPINPNLLIAAPILQDYFSDKNGVAMAGGTITCYHDNSRTTLKNWYYQSGTPGNYTYVPLPNPLTLSAAGTITDINGVDTIPFWYPYSETDAGIADPYYVTIVNYCRTNQITRANFPYLPSGSGALTTENTFNNLIINNGFWRNIKPNATTTSPYQSVALQSVANQNLDGNYFVVVAPSQHDGFEYPDIQFIINNITTPGADSVTFTPFPLNLGQPIENNVVSEYYLNHQCTNIGTGVTTKCYQFPISLHVNTLSGVPFTFTIQGQLGAGSAATTLSINILQGLGTGVTSPAVFPVGTITLNSSWQQYNLVSQFPTTEGLVLGNGADDALYLQVQLPLSSTCNINFTKPSIYLTQNIIPSYDFQTYDQVDPIINGARTGDIRVSVNDFYPYGWVPMNNGTLVNAGTVTPPTPNGVIAYQGTDAFRLYNLLWQKFHSYTINGAQLLPIYTAGGAPSTFTTAIADWSALKQLQLTHMIGQVMMGTVPTAAFGPTFKGTFVGSGTTITPVGAYFGFNGLPIYFGGTTTLTANNIYFMGNNTGTTFQVFTTFANAITQTSPQNVDATGSFVVAFNGSYLGEYAHVQQTGEVGSHTHTATSTFPGTTTGGAGNASIMISSVAGSGQTLVSTTIANNTPAGAPANVTQPSTFYNMYIKL